ncbi:MAG: hypothetical protein AAF526_13870 [Pseudomonadota bacterium]
MQRNLQGGIEFQLILKFLAPFGAALAGPQEERRFPAEAGSEKPDYARRVVVSCHAQFP